MTDRSVRVVLSAVTTQYQASMAKATAATRALGAQAISVGGATSVAQKGLAGLGLSTRMLAVGGLTLATAGLVKFAAEATTMASDLIEAQNKVDVVFGESADAVHAFAETSREIGIARTEALEAASAFGAMLDSAGVAEDASSEMSVTMTRLAADMASFNNQDPTEMLDRLRSGLAGEAEPLRRFGVFLSEATVKTYAYKNGIARAGEELTEAQKVQARYGVVLEHTKKQQGDFIRTLGESLPNQMRVARAGLEDFKTELGEFGLMVGSHVMPALNDFITALNEIMASGPRQADNLQSTKDLFTQLADGVQEGTISMEEFERAVQGNLEASRSLGSQLGLATDASYEELKQHVDELNLKLADGVPILFDGINALDQSAQAAGGADQATVDLTASLEEIVNEMEAAQTAAKELSTVFDALFGVNISAERAAIKYRDAVRDMVEAIKEAGGSIDAHTEKSDAARESILAALEATRDEGAALLEKGKSSEFARKRIEEHVAAIRDEAVAAGVSEEAIARYIRRLELTPKEIQTFIELRADKAFNDIERMKRELGVVDGWVASATLNVTTTGVVPAGGTPVKHAGGVAGAAGARRVGGPLRHDEIPSILQRGELVLSRAQVQQQDHPIGADLKGLVSRLEMIERHMRGPGSISIKLGGVTLVNEMNRMMRRQEVLLGGS